MTIHRRYGLGLLVTLLVVVYTFSNAGRFHIIDEVSLFALTESLALRGAVDTNAIAWTQWVNSPGEVLGEFGPDGQVFSKKGPGPALVAVPWYWLLHTIAQLDIKIGLLQGTLLWNGLVTALTAALLWLTAVRLGYADRTGAVLGLLFGLTTIAWPYANHFFGEPLSALSLLSSFYALLAYRQSGQIRWLWLAGAGAGLAIATVTAHALLVGILVLYWLAIEVDALRRARSLIAPKPAQVIIRLLLAFSAFVGPLLLAAGLLLWYNRVRFGDPLVTGYHFDSGEGFTTPITLGLWGLLVSPYRGVFWHTPLFLATPLGLVYFWRRHRWEAILVATLSLALIALYSMWWMWWGGFAWGPRFLVPLAPFWVLVLAPLAERLATSEWRLKNARRSPASSLQSPVPSPQSPVSGLQPPVSSLQSPVSRLPLGALRNGLLIALAALSFSVQVLAVSVNYVNYEFELRKIFPTDERNPLAFGPPAQRLRDLLYSPVIGQWQLLRSGWPANADLAWLHADGTVQVATLLVTLAALATLLFAGWSWWRSCSHKADENLPGWPVRLGLPILAVVVMATWLGESSRDPHYGLADEGYRALLSDLCRQAQPDDVVVTVAPYAYHLPMNWMGGLCARSLPFFGYATDSMQHAEAQQVLAQLTQVYRRIWFVTGGLPPNDADNSVEQWLATAAYKADDRWFNDYRLVRYATPRLLSDSQEVPLDMFLSDNKSQQVTIWAVRAPGVVSANEIIPVELIYQLDTPVTDNLRWFVQLLTAQDNPVALVDTAPAQGYASFPAMPVGEQFVEKAALQLPDQLAPGRYRLIAGLYNPAAPSPNRLITPTNRDHVDLGMLVVR